MGLILSASAGSGIEPIEPGTYPAICYGLVDAGETYNETYDKWSRKVVILWELPGEKIDLGGDAPVSRTISKSYTASLNEKAKLRADLQAWRGRPFTPQELAAFDLRSVVGAPCLLNIQHKKYKERNYADVAGIVKLPKVMPMEKGTLARLIFDLDTDNLEMLEDMPVWLAERVKSSRTYQARIHPAQVTDVLAMDDLAGQAAQAEQYGGIDDEEIPF